jgi:hypothetical protein
MDRSTRLEMSVTSSTGTNGIERVIVVPLRVQGRVVGALSHMFASRYSGRKYTVADVEFAEEVGRRASDCP